MQKVNHPLKARMFVGGLKSLLIDVVNGIEDIEKTGGVPKNFVENLADVKDAIDLTLKEFSKVTIRCCDHGTEHDVCDEDCDDNHSVESDEQEVQEDRDSEYYCEECDLPESECECALEEEPPPPPPQPVKRAVVRTQKRR